MDVSTDSPADSRADGRWMTLKELAASRRISVPSAARLMRRRKWRRQPGNDGHIRVWVPAGEQEPKGDDRADVLPDVSADGRRSDGAPDIRSGVRTDIRADVRAGIGEVVRPLQDAIAVLEAQLTEANARAARAEQSVNNERVRADVLRDKLEALQSELALAREAARAAEEHAAALRQAEDAEKVQAVAEAAVLRADLEAAHRLVTAAQERAAAIEQADVAREAELKGRGRWARLKAAWKGE